MRVFVCLLTFLPLSFATVLDAPGPVGLTVGRSSLAARGEGSARGAKKKCLTLTNMVASVVFACLGIFPRNFFRNCCY